MRTKMHNFFNYPFVKALFLGMSTLIIGGICSAMGQWDFSSDKMLVYKLIALVCFSLIYIFLIAYYSTNETNDRKIALILAKQNEAYEEVMSGLLNVCKKSADGANKVIKSIVSEKKAKLELWSFDEACLWVCQNVYNLLCEIGNGKDYEVIYDRLDESVKPEKDIYANSYANKDMECPSIFRKKRNIQNDSYHDAELFKLGNTKTEVLIGSEEIDKVFGHKTKEKEIEIKTNIISILPSRFFATMKRW